MSDAAQIEFLSRAATILNFTPSRILYSGAAAGDNHVASIFPSAELHTTDIVLSDSIDVVWDLEQIPPEHLLESYDLFISTSVLEHVSRPWLAAANIEKTVKKGGYIFVSVPWVWDFHEFPKDLWRFSRQALDVIFACSTPVATAWSTYPDCRLYNYNPYIDRKMILNSQGVDSDGLEYHRRGVPLLQVNQLRCKQ